MAITSPRRLSAAFALFSWGFLSWLLITWTVTAEQLVCGALISAAMTALLLPVMPRVVRPWALLAPGRALAAIRLIAVALTRIAVANVKLAGRIWSPKRPLTPGMVVVPSELTGEAEVAGAGLLSSLIVDNQLVDLDRRTKELQYHAVEVPDQNSDRTAAVTGGVEPLVTGLVRGRP